MTTLLWLRHDLRLSDQPALAWALRRGGAVVPVFILEPDGPWAPGAATRVFLHDALAALDDALRAAGSRLVLRQGDPVAVLRALAAETGAGALAFNQRMEPAGRRTDAAVVAALDGQLAIEQCNGALLLEPRSVATGSGGPYRVFTPFWRAVHAALQTTPPVAGAAPAHVPAPARWPDSLPLASLDLLPKIRWDAGIREHWPATEAAALDRLETFLDDGVERYAATRDFPAQAGVSRLSPYLHLGQLSPRQVWATVQARAAAAGQMAPGETVLAWLRQLVWREFAHHLLFHFPHTTDAPLRQEFERLPWVEDAAGYHRWCHGETGYPVVDAGMRELWATGFMHNRVRMIVASFLTKDLGVHWLRGAAWFWDTLVDANLANNTLGWQWTAGCGADAAPYFRIFNPVSQSAKFDGSGAYLRRWLPELAALPDADLHAPWLAPPVALAAAGVTLGKTYPAPMLDHALARREALARLERTRA